MAPEIEKLQDEILRLVCRTNGTYNKAKSLVLTVVDKTRKGSEVKLGVGASGLAAICALLASEELGNDEVTRSAAERASALSPHVFSDTLYLVRKVLQKPVVKESASAVAYEPTYQSLVSDHKILRAETVMGWMEDLEKALLRTRRFRVSNRADHALLKCAIFYRISRLIGISKIREDDLQSKYNISQTVFDEFLGNLDRACGGALAMIQEEKANVANQLKGTSSNRPTSHRDSVSDASHSASTDAPSVPRSMRPESYPSTYVGQPSTSMRSEPNSSHGADRKPPPATVPPPAATPTLTHAKSHPSHPPTNQPPASRLSQGQIAPTPMPQLPAASSDPRDQCKTNSLPPTSLPEPSTGSSPQSSSRVRKASLPSSSSMSTSSSPERVSQSEEEPRPAKRARLEQQDATKQSPQSALISTVPSHTKAEGLWLDDGSVILLAESTQFRVHRTVLSMHSPILADILNKPVGDRIEGCPVFPLSSSARDVTNFLKYLYDPLDLDTGGKVVYPVMFGVLHLSAKYGVSKLRSKSFSLLGLQVLTSLESVNKLRYAELTPEMMWWLIQAINIGREINMLELLPGAFYLCCAMPTEFILRGVSLDGVEARLSVGDRASCLLGRDRLLDVQQQETWSFLYNPQASSACTDDKRCSSRILKPLWQSCRYSPLTTPRTLSVYRYWDDLVDDKYCCRNCSDKLREDQEIAVEGAWKKLPEYFSLGSWEDLRGHGT